MKLPRRLIVNLPLAFSFLQSLSFQMVLVRWDGIGWAGMGVAGSDLLSAAGAGGRRLRVMRELHDNCLVAMAPPRFVTIFAHISLMHGSLETGRNKGAYSTNALRVGEPCQRRDGDGQCSANIIDLTVPGGAGKKAVALSAE